MTTILRPTTATLKQNINKTPRQPKPTKSATNTQLVNIRNSIMVYYDHTKSAQATLDYAIEMATKLQLAVTILSSPKKINFLQQNRRNIELRKLCKDINSKYAIKVTYLIKKGKPVGNIIACANDYDPFMVLMPRKTKLKVFNSLAVEVAGEIKQPVLVVPKKASYQDLDEIIYTINYGKRDYKHLRKISKIAKGTSAFINVATLHKLRNTKQQSMLMHAFRMMKQRMNYPFVYAGKIYKKLPMIRQEDASKMLVIKVKHPKNYLYQLATHFDLKNYLKVSAVPTLLL